MTKIIIRAIKDRSEEIAYLKDKLPEAEWCFDTTRNAMDTFKAAMAMAGEEPVVHMEEDILLTSNFVDKIESVIREHPYEVIQFFSMRKKDIEIGSRYENGSTFMMNQCFYLPAGVSGAILEYSKTWGGYDKYPTGYDIMMADFFRLNKMKYWIQVPSLVQHKVIKSAINPKRSSKRQSITFRED